MLKKLNKMQYLYNMKTIKINKQQHNRLFEARMDGFRLDFLTQATSYKQRVNYCKKMLGSPIGSGSSRLVFQLDDETCLKLAKNEKGVAQNMEEISVARDNFVSFIPKIYNGSDEENGLWIVTQCVVPAKVEDFQKVLNMDFGDVANFTMAMDGSFNYRMPQFHRNSCDRFIRNVYIKYEDNDEAVELLNAIHELKCSYSQQVSDLSRIQNWGLAQENGQPCMVMLDAALTEEIWMRHYRR